MRLIGLAVVVTLNLTLAPLAAEAQQAPKVPRIGLLLTGNPPDPNVEAFQEALRELGYVEARTSRSTIGGQTGELIYGLNLRRRWSVSRWT
jgi:hypothetical protein